MKLFSWSLLGVLSNGLKEHVGVQLQVAADGKMELVSNKHLGFEEEGGAAFPDLARYQWKNQPKEKIDAERAEFKGKEGEITKFRSLNQERCISAGSDKDATLTFSDCGDNSDQLLWRLRSDGSYESLAYPGSCARQDEGQDGDCDYPAKSVGLGACPGFKTYSKGYGMVLKLMHGRQCHLKTNLRYSFGGPVHPDFKDNVYTTAATTQWTTTANWGDVWERVATTTGEAEAGEAEAGEATTQYCNNGWPNSKGTKCCHKECGQGGCGGSGCSDRGGGQQCCAGGISNNCLTSDEVGCTIPNP